MPRKRHPTRQRKSDNLIAHDFELLLRKPTTSESMLNLLPQKISFTLTATSQDREALFILGGADPKHLGELISLEAQRVYKDKVERLHHPRPRGIHAEVGKEDARKIFMQKARAFVSAAHTVISYWIKQPEDQWPNHFRIKVEQLKKSGVDFKSQHKNRILLYPFVHFLFDQQFNKERRLLGLKKLETDSFIKKYLKSEYKQQAKHFFKPEMTVEELFDLMI